MIGEKLISALETITDVLMLLVAFPFLCLIVLLGRLIASDVEETIVLDNYRRGVYADQHIAAEGIER